MTVQLDLFSAATDADIRAWAQTVGLDCPKVGIVPPSLHEAHESWAANPHDVVTHALLPNMAWACCEDLLACRCCTSVMRGRPTCPWCRSLGPAWKSWACSIIQGRDPINGEPRNTDAERQVLAGVTA